MRFSTFFLRISTLSLLGIAVASCAYVIPVDPNEPRNNKVEGEMRRPKLNNVKGKGASLERPTRQVAQVDMKDLPPADEDYADRVPRVMASNDVPTPAVAPASSGRRVPSENQQFQMASMGYPEINSVPPRPTMTGPDSAKERLDGVRSTLEKDRANADASKEQLGRDAAAEPSMLNDLPKTEGVVPPNDPVRAAPVTPNMQMPPAVIVPTVKPTSSNPYPPQRVASNRTTAPGLSAGQTKRYAPEYAAPKQMAAVSMPPMAAPLPVVVQPAQPVVVASAPVQVPVMKPVDVAVAPVPYPAPTPPEPVKQMVVASAAPAPVYTSPTTRNDANERLVDLPPMNPDSDTMVVQQRTYVTPPTIVAAQPVQAQPLQVEAAPVVVKKQVAAATVIATPPSVPMLPPPPPAAASMTSALPPVAITASAAPVREAPVNLKRGDFDPMTVTDEPMVTAYAVPTVGRGDFDPLAAAAAADANPGRPGAAAPSRYY